MNLVDTIACVLKQKGKNVWSVSPEAWVYDAIEMMANKRVGALLVMTEGKLVGIVSERDYARKVILQGKLSKQTQVKEIMSSPVIFVRPEHTVEDCMRFMTNSSIRHLPVVESEKVLGVVSIGDLVKWIVSAQEETIHHLQRYITGKYPGDRSEIHRLLLASLPFDCHGFARCRRNSVISRANGPRMSTVPILRLGAVKDVQRFKEHLRSLGLKLPCDQELYARLKSPISSPLVRGGFKFSNRIAVQPMEGWDALPDGNPSEFTVRRWRRFGQSGAGLVWGGEAVAVTHEGRANPNQLVIAPHTHAGLASLRAALLESHREATGSAEPPLVGLQLTHSGRYCRPHAHDRPEPRILYHHPILDSKLGLTADSPLLTDDLIAEIIDGFRRAARAACDLGFDFVDIKHCHGYLGHEFLSGHTRPGKFGGSFENRTRFLREVVAGIRAVAPGLHIAVRLSAFDTVPFRPNPETTIPGKPGMGIPEPHSHLIPYQWGFGVHRSRPTEMDLSETVQFLALLEDLGIRLVNLTAGSPYYNPHIQRPALYPPSDGYHPPEDPLIGVARQMSVARDLKSQFPQLIIVGTAFSYLQDFLPHVAQAALREGWVDFVGVGRMILSYPGLLLDTLEGRPVQHRLVCRTFSDCTTAPRKGLPSGCYPLDEYYKASELGVKLKSAKAKQP